MLGVARDAILSRCVRREPHGVHAPSLRHPLANLRVAIEASELNFSAAKFVTLGAA
jgi:hypothetical protein